MYTRNLNQISTKDRPVAGGKGAALGEMLKADIQVPPGFAILTNAFDQFLGKEDLDKEIDLILRDINQEEIAEVENASKKIQILILNSEVPEEISDEITKSFVELGIPKVAVRSSATTEDGSSAAWAGQLESYLNTTKEDLLENVKRCWASLFTTRAILYRFKKQTASTISVAVVVQKMIESEAAGTAFSVHPVTQDANQILIEAGLGLGDTLVSGEITPDSYVVAKDSKNILSKSLQNKNRVLSDDKVLELTKLVSKIERHFGFPCDIEWALERNIFYILQSRPITTLEPGSKTESFRIFKKFFSRKAPLIITEAWHKGEYYRLKELLRGATHFNPLFIQDESGVASVYYDINNSDTALQPLIDFVLWHPKDFFELADAYEKSYLEFLKVTRASTLESLGRLFELLVEIHGFLPFLVQIGILENSALDKKIVRRAYGLREKFQVKNDPVEKFLGAVFKEHWPEYYEFRGVLRISEMLSHRFPQRSGLEKRKQGFIFFEQNIITNMNKHDFEKKHSLKLDDDLQIIGEFDTDYQILSEHHMMLIAKRNTDIFHASLRVKSWSEGLSKELGFGYEAIVINSDGEYYVDSRSEDRISELLNTKKTEDALSYINKMYDLKEEILKDLREKKTGSFAEDFSGLFTYFFIARRIAESVFEKSDPKDQKLIESWRNDETLFEPLDLFYKNHPQDDSRENWSVVFCGNNLKVLDKKLAWHKVEEVSAIIKGGVAYPGHIKGRVKIVWSKDEVDQIKDGEILVTHMTTPEYLPALEKAAAFVTDEGGITSHAAISARELKKPCIVGTKNATKKLKDGFLVEVDADHGVVKIISH